MTRTTTHPTVTMTRSAFPWQPSALLPDDGGQGGHQDPPPADGGTPGAAPTQDAPTPTADSGKTFTQEELDRIIGERLASRDKTWEQKLKDAQATAGKSELEAAQIKAQQAEERAAALAKTAAERVTAAEAKAVALSLGTKPDRVAALIKHADLTAAVDDDGNVDDSKVRAAIEKALTDFPEWKATTTVSASGGDIKPGSGSDKPTFTRAQIEGMSQDELIRRVDEINEAMADGRVTG